MNKSTSDSEIRVGASQCLLGDPVRFDTGHKRDPFLTDILAEFFRWVPVCPEVELGMGIPRPPVRLVHTPTGEQMLQPKTGKDFTRDMTHFCRKRINALRELDLCGYVLKKGSPSCGMERVKVYPLEGGQPRKDGVGLFAAELKRQLPLLPLEEEGRLHDPVLRENFIERIFAYRRWKDFMSERFTRGRLVEFHTRHKYLLLSHSPQDYRELGKIVAMSKTLGAEKAKSVYGEAFMQAMAKRTTIKKHTNVLLHMNGFLKKELSNDMRRELTDVVEDYRLGLIPLIVPMTLIRHHARAVGQPYLLGQVYLDPHPKELRLRNHV
jgi:uncharacterized protein YbgA (DUF1722 family)/uncharacterized protein YbbK (DUF523 family)